MNVDLYGKVVSYLFVNILSVGLVQSEHLLVLYALCQFIHVLLFTIVQGGPAKVSQLTFLW